MYRVETDVRTDAGNGRWGGNKDTQLLHEGRWAAWITCQCNFHSRAKSELSDGFLVAYLM